MKTGILVLSDFQRYLLMMVKKDDQKQAKSYMRYAGMAFELVALLAVAVFLGQKLDAWLEFEKNYASLIILFSFLIAYLFRVYHSLMK